MRATLLLALGSVIGFLVAVVVLKQREVAFEDENAASLLSNTKLNCENVVTEVTSKIPETPPVILKGESPSLRGDRKYYADCDLCERNWLFILATGRSGSTTVLNMIDALPHINLAGENGGALNKIYELPFFPGNTFKAQMLSGSDPAFKHRQVRPKELLCWTQEYFLDIIGGEYSGEEYMVHGFKTIRVWSKELLDFILEVFPCARFVISYREDLERQHESTFQKSKSVEELEQLTEILVNFAKKFGETKAFLMPLEKFSIDSFNRLAEWIGYSDCQFSRVVRANDNGGYTEDMNTSLEGSCKFSSTLW